jgi:hypothetical protein
MNSIDKRLKRLKAKLPPVELRYQTDEPEDSNPLPYPPPWQDTVTLAKHLSISPQTVVNWSAQGILPPPRRRGAKLMWKWSEVDAWLTEGPSASGVGDLVERIREGSRRALEEEPPYKSISIKTATR